MERGRAVGFVPEHWRQGGFVQTQPARGLLEFLQQVPDPRGRKGRRHSLSAMLAALVCAMFSGVRGLRPLEQWLSLQEPPFWHLLGFTRTPPKRMAFTRLLAKIDAEALLDVLLQFVNQLGSFEQPADPSPEAELEVEVWDGKTLRGTRKDEARTQQILVRMDLMLKRVLSSRLIPPETNEAGAALQMVKDLVLKGKLILVDAAHCQREFCQEITDKEGDYLVMVKDNQPQLLRDIEQAFVIPRSFSPLPTA